MQLQQTVQQGGRRAIQHIPRAAKIAMGFCTPFAQPVPGRGDGRLVNMKEVRAFRRSRSHTIV